MEEEWLELDSYPGYFVSNMGRIRKKGSERFLKAGPDKHGYPQVVLYGKTLRVSRLVALEFVDGYFQDAEARHINGNKLDCRAENLMWVQKGYAAGRPSARDRIVAIYDGTTEERIWSAPGWENR